MKLFRIFSPLNVFLCGDEFSSQICHQHIYTGRRALISGGYCNRWRPVYISETSLDAARPSFQLLARNDENVFMLASSPTKARAAGETAMSPRPPPLAPSVHLAASQLKKSLLTGLGADSGGWVK